MMKDCEGRREWAWLRCRSWWSYEKEQIIDMMYYKTSKILVELHVAGTLFGYIGASCSLIVRW